MKGESLEKASSIIVKALIEANIDELDKIELVLNLNNFLNKNNYEENVKILSKKKG